MEKAQPRRPAASLLSIMTLAAAMCGCADEHPAETNGSIARAPHAMVAPAETVPPRDVPLAPAASPPARLDASVGATRPGDGIEADAGGQWFATGESVPVAMWGAVDSESVLRLRCDAKTGRIVLAREAHALPVDARIVTLEADGIRMDYPAERVATTLGAELVTGIALDAPILDRMLSTSTLAVRTGNEVIRTTAPGPVLRPIVEACRARH